MDPEVGPRRTMFRLREDTMVLAILHEKTHFMQGSGF